jgi:hypothetical protein
MYKLASSRHKRGSILLVRRYSPPEQGRSIGASCMYLQVNLRPQVPCYSSPAPLSHFLHSLSKTRSAQKIHKQLPLDAVKQQINETSRRCLAQNMMQAKQCKVWMRIAMPSRYEHTRGGSDIHPTLSRTPQGGQAGWQTQEQELVQLEAGTGLRCR